MISKFETLKRLQANKLNAFVAVGVVNAAAYFQEVLHQAKNSSSHSSIVMEFSFIEMMVNFSVVVAVVGFVLFGRFFSSHLFSIILSMTFATH